MAEPGELIGQLVFGYRVEELIGQGSQGDIYRMRHPSLPDRVLALKVLRLKSAANTELRSRFWQDALAASKVGVAGVVQPLHIDHLDDGRPYIVMELAPGKSLDRVLREEGPLAVRDALAIASSVAATMDAVHKCSIVHRDIKPANLMVERDANGDFAHVKLLDFGVARVSSEIRKYRTADGTVLGTRSYMAPEVALGAPFDGRADVYSLGVVLYEMLTGQVPFRDLRETASTTPAADPATRRPLYLEPVPPAVSAVLASALHKNADARYQMVELHAALEGLRQSLPATALPRRTTMPSIGMPAMGNAPAVAPVDMNAAATDILPSTEAGAAPRPTMTPSGMLIAAPGAAPRKRSEFVTQPRETMVGKRALRIIVGTAAGVTIGIGALAATQLLPRLGRDADPVVAPAHTVELTAVLPDAALPIARDSRPPGAPPTAAAPPAPTAITKPENSQTPKPPPRRASNGTGMRALTWSRVPLGTTHALHDVWSDGAGSVVIVGEHGTILRSTDGGKNWEQHLWTSSPVHLYGVWGAGSERWAVGDHGTILHTADGGASWTRQLGGTATVLTGIWGASATDLYVVGNPSTILHSSDGGKNWTREPSGTGNGLRRVWGSGPEDVWVVGWGETILHSVDGGRSFRERRHGHSAILYDVWGAGGTVLAVGARRPPPPPGAPANPHRADDLVLRSSDGGQRWEQLATGTHAPLYAVGGGGGDDVYLGGPAGTILHLGGDGAWTRVEVAGAPHRKLSRILDDGAGVFIVGLEGLLLHGE